MAPSPPAGEFLPLVSPANDMGTVLTQGCQQGGKAPSGTATAYCCFCQEWKKSKCKSEYKDGNVRFDGCKDDDCPSNHPGGGNEGAVGARKDDGAASDAAFVELEEALDASALDKLGGDGDGLDKIDWDKVEEAERLWHFGNDGLEDDKPVAFLEEESEPEVEELEEEEEEEGGDIPVVDGEHGDDRADNEKTYFHQALLLERRGTTRFVSGHNVFWINWNWRCNKNVARS